MIDYEEGNVLAAEALAHSQGLEEQLYLPDNLHLWVRPELVVE